MTSKEPSSQEFLDVGLAALEAAEFEDAIELFERAAVEDSANARAWFYLGLCYLETSRPQDALESLDRSIAADGRVADAYYLRGTTLGALGQIDRAAKSYREALAIDPQHQKAEEFLIRTEALLASREHFRSAVRLIYEDAKPDDWINLAARELLHSVAIFKESPARGDFGRLAARIIESGECRVDTEAAINEGPFWTGIIERAQAAFDRKSWPEAASNYNEALELSSEHAFVHHMLGLIYFSLGDTESGITAWQRACDIDPDFDLSKMRRVSR